jgi:3-keto-5-aminohexanoate cleavage enzyme
MDDRPHVQFAMGVQDAMPAEEHLLDILLGELQRVLPKATWTVAGIGRHQDAVIEWVLARGGKAIRTGLEDNIRVGKDRLANSNAELVKIAADICRRYDSPPHRTRRERCWLCPSMTTGSLLTGTIVDITLQS